MTLAAQAAAGGAVGFAAGLLFFRALQHNAALYLETGPAWRPIALHVARLLLLSALLLGIVLASDAAGLLAAFAGILAARAVALRTRRAGP